MHPHFHILGKDIPAYWLCALVGAAAVSLLLFSRHKKYSEFKQVDITNAAALAAVGMIIGGRVLYLITILPAIIRNWSFITSDLKIALEIVSNGMVFYGGLFGAVITLGLYAKKYKLNVKMFFDYFAPGIPLFHVFGRIGCFLTGCCHGVVSERFGIAFTNSISSANGVPYLPVQLMEAFVELILFIVVCRYADSHRGTGKALELYLLLYAIARFALEFLRGDAVRGFVLGLSTSQWISIFVLLVLSLRKALDYGTKKATNA